MRQIEPAPPMNPGIVPELLEISRRVDGIRKQFASLSTPHDTPESVFDGYNQLKATVTHSDYVIKAEHFGTVLYFELRLAIDENGEPIGRVICTLEHSVFGKEERELLGAFSILSHGRTDLPGDERGQPTALPRDADRIVAYFLHKAHRANLNLDQGV